MVCTRKTINAKAPNTVELTSFSIIWPDELETTLINIMRRYIERGKLVDNVFKKIDFVSMAVEL
jgi:hypothetical protein